MNDDSILPTRLKAGAPGLGQASEAEIVKRAIELAASDGRNSFTDADLERAAAELAGGKGSAAPPEVDESVEKLSAWDEVPDESGHQVPETPLEDDASVAEELIQDGMEEADHDLRAAAEDDEA